MIAHQELAAAFSRPAPCKSDNTAGIRSAIDKISKKNHRLIGWPPRVMIRLDERHELFQQVKAAMNIANRIDPLALWQAWCRGTWT